MSITDLKPTNGRKSFYGKAQIIEEGAVKKLRSYSTIVAEYNTEKDEVKIKGWYSTTTANHINSFLEHLGKPKMTKAEMLNSSK